MVSNSDPITEDVCYRKATGLAGLDWPGPVTDGNREEYELHLRCMGCGGKDLGCPAYRPIIDPQFGK